MSTGVPLAMDVSLILPPTSHGQIAARELFAADNTRPPPRCRSVEASQDRCLIDAAVQMAHRL